MSHTSESAQPDRDRRTRRQVLVAAAFGFGGVVAGRLGAVTAQASNGDPMLAGNNVSSTQTTGIISSGDGLTVEAGNGNTAVKAISAGNGIAVLAEGGVGTSLWGLGSVGGKGVVGQGTIGVQAFTYSGGTGVDAYAATDGTGFALEAHGTALFDGPIRAARTGFVSITYPKRTATITVPGGLGPISLILAMMQNVVAGVYVASTVPDLTLGTVAINLNKAPGSAKTPLTANVAWFVVN